MKNFVVKILLITLPLILVGTVIELLLRLVPNDYVYKKEYLDAHSNEIETLILGSSHSFYGINPELLTNSAFNASHISQSLSYDYEILKKYQNEFRSLETVVLPISYFTFYQDFVTSEESWRAKNYIIYYKINSSPSPKHHT